MLIISSFKDYYDPVAAQYLDKSIVYKREEKDDNILPTVFIALYREFSIPHVKNNKLSTYENIFAIGFCGKLHLGVRFVQTDTKRSYSEEQTVYGSNIIDNIIRLGDNSKNYKFKQKLSKCKDFIQRTHLKDVNDVHIKLNTPVFYVRISYGLGDQKFKANPCLKDYNFQSHIDPFTAFQEIQSYISGVLGTNENNTVEISNKDKILQAGFDLKTSFRKDKK